jgi:hypothetical protein
MNNEETTFENWFSCLKVCVLEKTGVEFNDEDAVREDYDQGYLLREKLATA